MNVIPSDAVSTEALNKNNPLGKNLVENNVPLTIAIVPLVAIGMVISSVAIVSMITIIAIVAMVAMIAIIVSTVSWPATIVCNSTKKETIEITLQSEFEEKMMITYHSFDCRDADSDCISAVEAIAF